MYPPEAQGRTEKAHRTEGQVWVGYLYSLFLHPSLHVNYWIIIGYGNRHSQI